jgi:RHS repeat-associated protein
VLVTISDKKLVDTYSGNTVTRFKADVVSATDYYPGGMLMPGRTYSSGAYRYGFNGQEKSTEVNDNSYTAEFWQYDARIGRRWNLDPRPSVDISPYAAFNNNPIFYSDPLGDTVVHEAGGTHNIDIDEKANSLEFYGSSNYKINGTNTDVPVQSGQLRSFTNGLGTFTAKWTTDANGAAVFAGYKNEKGRTIEQVVKFVNSWKFRAAASLISWGNSEMEAYNKDPLAYNIKLSTTMLAASVTEAIQPSPFLGFNPSTVTQESMSALGTLRFTTSGENLAFGLGQNLDMFSLAGGFKNYKQFTSGGFKEVEILSAIKNPNNNLHFNLQDFTRWKYLKYSNNPVAPSPALRNITNWELHTIYNTPGALERTKFYNLINNSYQAVPKPF